MAELRSALASRDEAVATTSNQLAQAELQISSLTEEHGESCEKNESLISQLESRADKLKVECQAEKTEKTKVESTLDAFVAALSELQATLAMMECCEQTMKDSLSRCNTQIETLSSTIKEVTSRATLETEMMAQHNLSASSANTEFRISQSKMANAIQESTVYHPNSKRSKW